MENRSNHIRSNRTDCKHNFRILNQRTSGGRIRKKTRTDKNMVLIDRKLLFSNKYYLMICVTYICQRIYSAMLNMVFTI